MYGQVDKAVLVAARALVAKGWCQDVYARDADGREVDPKSSNAVAWCALGALRAVSGRWQNTIRLVELGLKMGLTNFNDEPGCTQERVLALYDEAIAKLA